MPTAPKARLSWREPTMIALETLRTHKLRSFLTLLGIILSVTTLIVVVAMIEGANRYIATKVVNFGANVFLVSRFPIITSIDQFVKLQRRNKVITWDDYEYVRDNMRLARNVGLEVRRNGRVKYKTETIEDIDIRGVTANIGEMDVEEPATGRYISDADNEHRANVTLIGNDVDCTGTIEMKVCIEKSALGRDDLAQFDKEWSVIHRSQAIPCCRLQQNYILLSG